VLVPYLLPRTRDFGPRGGVIASGNVTCKAGIFRPTVGCGLLGEAPCWVVRLPPPDEIDPWWLSGVDFVSEVWGPGLTPPALALCRI
jgi:hypothetical protein